jgi:hypothetical protein
LATAAWPARHAAASSAVSSIDQWLDLVREVEVDAGTGESGTKSTASKKMQYIIMCDEATIDELLLKYTAGAGQGRGEEALFVDPEKLHWAPLYVTDPKKDKWRIQ